MRNFFTIFMLFLLSASCSGHRWPPFQTQLKSLFNDNFETITAIELEMIGDGLPLIGTGLNKSFRHPNIPELTESQQNKYALLFEELGFYANFHRFDSETRVDLVSKEARSRTFVFFFLHGIVPALLPLCESVAEMGSCGTCYVSLDSDWYLEYLWYNDDQSFSPKECLGIQE